VTLEDAWTEDGSGLLAIAIDPHFDRTHFVYAIYTAARARGERVFRLARFREWAGVLAERTVLMDLAPSAPSRPTASLRFGPDGKLYAALDDGGDAARIGNLALYNGKILRLNTDGTTPADQPMASPVYAYGTSRPGGLGWQDGTGALWLAGRDIPDAGALAAYRGDLIIAVRSDPAVRRVRFDARDPSRIAEVEPLVEHAPGMISALAVSPDGVIYLSVNDELLRLVPVP
jgi:glucose/arabinose dehydrogenase